MRFCMRSFGMLNNASNPTSRWWTDACLYVAAAQPKRKRLESEDITSPQTSAEVSAVDWQLRFTVSALTKRSCCYVIPFFWRVARIVTEQVAWSVCLSVCHCCLLATQKRLNRSRCRLVWGLLGSNEPQISPRGTEHFLILSGQTDTWPRMPVGRYTQWLTRWCSLSPSILWTLVDISYFICISWPTTGYFADWSNFCHVTFAINNHCTVAMTKVKFGSILSLFTLINARSWE